MSFISHAAWAWSKAGCELPRTIPDKVFKKLELLITSNIAVVGDVLNPITGGTSDNNNESVAPSLSPETLSAIEECLPSAYRTYSTILWVLFGVGLFIVISLLIILFTYIIISSRALCWPQILKNTLNPVVEQIERIADAADKFYYLHSPEYIIHVNWHLEIAKKGKKGAGVEILNRPSDYKIDFVHPSPRAKAV